MTTAITVTSFETVWDQLVADDGTPRSLAAQDALLAIHAEMKAIAQQNAELTAALESMRTLAEDFRQQRDLLSYEIKNSARRITRLSRAEIAHCVNYEMLDGLYGDQVAEDLLLVLMGDNDSLGYSTVNRIKDALTRAAEELADLYDLPQRSDEDDE